MTTDTKHHYFEGVGKRKTAVARVRLTPAGKTSYTVNGKSLDVYFLTAELQTIVKAAFVIEPALTEHFVVSVKVIGGGSHAQAEAVRHGIARALLKKETTLKPALKKSKLLTRDAREKERRKFGLKKARKSPQWSKR